MDWYPRYPALWRAKTRHLDPFQDGCYMRLVDEYMETRQPLPDNDAALARIIGISLEQWLATASGIVRAFFEPKDGLLFHDRCDKILSEQDARERKQSEKSRKGAEARWKKNKDLDATGIAQAMPIYATGQDRTIQEEKKEDKSSFQKTEKPSTKQMPKLIFDEEPKVKNVKRKSALKDDWKPNDSHRAKCAERGLDAGKLCEEFRNYHLARGNLFADWDRAFFTWIGNAERFGGGKAVGGSGQSGVGGIVEAGLRVAARYKNQG